MMKRATRQDVAAAAGVSGATVSRVYNNPALVDKDTADRVRTWAATLGFVPDKHAAALRRGSSGAVLFVEIEEPGYHWPSLRTFQSLYGEVIRAVLLANQQSPLSLQLVSLPSAADIPTLRRFGDFEGILGFDVVDQGAASALAALGRPVVCAHHGDHLEGVSTITSDNREGGRLQAQHLLEGGHRSVAYVTGHRDDLRSHRHRWEGFSEVLAPLVCVDGHSGYGPGVEAGKLLAAEVRSGGLSGFACVNDLTALGVVHGLVSEGVAVPGDAEVVGYDNLALVGLLGPGIPTVDARLPAIYTRALEVLHRRIGDGLEPLHETVSPKLITGPRE